MLMEEIESFCTEDIIKFSVSTTERDVPERRTRVSLAASKPSGNSDSVEEAVDKANKSKLTWVADLVGMSGLVLTQAGK